MAVRADEPATRLTIAGASPERIAPIEATWQRANYLRAVQGELSRTISQVDQIESAREAARRANAKLGGRPAAGAVVFDCICRNLILQAEFGSAVRAMVEELGGAPLAGFETYGEIALDAGDMSGFHNTTSVVLAFPR